MEDQLQMFLQPQAERDDEFSEQLQALMAKQEQQDQKQEQQEKQLRTLAAPPCRNKCKLG